MVFFQAQSNPRTLKDAPASNGAYHVLLQAVIDVSNEQKWNVPNSLTYEEIAYGFWAMVHGQVMLQFTDLQGFDADFKKADALLVRHFIQGFEK